MEFCQLNFHPFSFLPVLTEPVKFLIKIKSSCVFYSTEKKCKNIVVLILHYLKS